MQKLFITATGTNVGKTYTTLRLIEKISQSGIKVGDHSHQKISPLIHSLYQLHHFVLM